MSRKYRPYECDNDAPEITRPDNDATLDGDEAPSSGFQQRGVDELIAYSALPASFNEPTVPDAPLRHLSTLAPRVASETPVSALPPAPALPRAEAAAVPPPRQARKKLDSSVRGSSRPEGQPRRHAEAAAGRAPLSDRRREIVRGVLLVLGTVVGSAALGASLGNGSLARALARLSDNPTEHEVAPAPPVVSGRPPLRASAGPTDARASADPSGARPAAAPSVAKAPVLRFEQLPVAKPNH